MRVCVTKSDLRKISAHSHKHTLTGARSQFKRKGKNSQNEKPANAVAAQRQVKRVTSGAAAVYTTLNTATAAAARAMTSTLGEVVGGVRALGVEGAC